MQVERTVGLESEQNNFNSRVNSVSNRDVLDPDPARSKSLDVYPAGSQTAGSDTSLVGNVIQCDFNY